MGFVSDALFPFWRLDAKGGEVLLGSLRGICMRWTQACAFIIFIALVSLYVIWNLFASYVL